MKKISPIKQFVVKAILLAIMYACVYSFVFKPLRQPDKWLTNIVAKGVAFSVDLFSSLPEKASIQIHETEQTYGVKVVQGSKDLIYIADVCNGLGLIGLYAALIILLPYSFYRKLAFISFGIVLLTVANIARCVGLIWVYYNHPSWFEFNHHYVFTFVMYIVIFIGWIVYTSKKPAYAK